MNQSNYGGGQPLENVNLENWKYERPVVYSNFEQCFAGIFPEMPNRTPFNNMEFDEIDAYRVKFGEWGYDFNIMMRDKEKRNGYLQTFENKAGDKYVIFGIEYAEGMKMQLILSHQDLDSESGIAEIEGIIFQNENGDCINLIEMVDARVFLEKGKFDPRVEKDKNQDKKMYLHPLLAQNPGHDIIRNAGYQFIKHHQALVILHEQSHLELGHLDEKEKSNLVEKEREAVALSFILYDLYRKMGFDFAKNQSREQIFQDMLAVHMGYEVNSSDKLADEVMKYVMKGVLT